jgi:hypothetical protein
MHLTHGLGRVAHALALFRAAFGAEVLAIPLRCSTSRLAIGGYRAHPGAQ